MGEITWQIHVVGCSVASPFHSILAIRGDGNTVATRCSWSVQLDTQPVVLLGLVSLYHL